MSLITLLVVLVLVGLALYVVGQLPIDATVKRIIWAIVVVVLVLWLLDVLVGFDSLYIGGPRHRLR